jgi:hypothetical protein
MQVAQKMSNFDGIISTSHTFSYPIYSHMALDQCQLFGYDSTRDSAVHAGMEAHESAGAGHEPV